MTEKRSTPRRLKFLDYTFDNLNEREFEQQLRLFLGRQKTQTITVLNANKIYLMKKDPELASFILNSDLILPENAINLAFLLRGRRLKQWNMGGLPRLKTSLQLATREGWPVFFLGAKREVVEKMVERLPAIFPGIKIAGYHHGYFTKEEEKAIVDEINRSGALLLFVGLGSPRQEKWMARHQAELKVKVIMGVGGSFKVLAGVEKEAPAWSKYGLEWLYRTFQDPAKINRYLKTNCLFLFLLLKFMIKNQG